jgi:hypothetical protein
MVSTMMRLSVGDWRRSYSNSINWYILINEEAHRELA